MFATRCPNCGRPVSLSVATPQHMHCSGCGFDGRPPADAVERLLRAAAILRVADARERQLSVGLQRTLTSLEAFRSRFVWIAVLANIPMSCFLGLAFLGLAIDEKPTPPVMYVAMALPWAGMVAAAVLGYRWAKQQRARLEQACAARPSLQPGEPDRCHVCGAPIAPGGPTRHVARCDYCGADNLVDPELLAQLRREQERSFGDYEQSIEQELKKARSASRQAAVGAVLAVLFSPCLFLFVFTLLFATVGQIPQPAAPLRYAWVDLPAGRCVGEVDELYGDGGHRLIFSTGTPADHGDLPLESAPTETLAPESFVGMTLRTSQGTGLVRAVHSSLLVPGNQIVIELDGGTTDEAPLAGSCMAAP